MGSPAAESAFSFAASCGEAGLALFIGTVTS